MEVWSQSQKSLFNRLLFGLSQAKELQTTGPHQAGQESTAASSGCVAGHV